MRPVAGQLSPSEYLFVTNALRSASFVTSPESLYSYQVVEQNIPSYRRGKCFKGTSGRLSNYLNNYEELMWNIFSLRGINDIWKEGVIIPICWLFKPWISLESLGVYQRYYLPPLRHIGTYGRSNSRNGA